MSGVGLTGDNMAILALTFVVLLASFALFAAAFAVVVAIVVGGAVSFAGGSILAVRVPMFIMVFTAAISVLGCTLSRHFFFWPHLPCPGPGMLSRETEKKTKKKRKTEGLVLGSETGSVVLYSWFCGSVVL